MPIQAAVGHMAMGSLNRPVLGLMGRSGFGHQYTTQMKVLMKKTKIFGQNWPIDNCFPIFAFFDKFTSAFVFEFYVCLNFWKFISISNKIPYIFALK